MLDIGNGIVGITLRKIKTFNIINTFQVSQYNDTGSFYEQDKLHEM
jgi:hypothetical protein